MYREGKAKGVDWGFLSSIREPGRGLSREDNFPPFPPSFLGGAGAGGGDGGGGGSVKKNDPLFFMLKIPNPLVFSDSELKRSFQVHIHGIW